MLIKIYYYHYYSHYVCVRELETNIMAISRILLALSCLLFLPGLSQRQRPNFTSFYSSWNENFF